MTTVLKGRKLWRYVVGSIPKLVPLPMFEATVDDDASKTIAITDRG